MTRAAGKIINLLGSLHCQIQQFIFHRIDIALLLYLNWFAHVQGIMPNRKTHRIECVVHCKNPDRDTHLDDAKLNNFSK